MAANRVGWSSGSVGEVWLLATEREFKRFADFVEIVAAIAGVKAMLHRPNEVVHVQRHRDGHPTLSKPEQRSDVSMVVLGKSVFTLNQPRIAACTADGGAV